MNRVITALLFLFSFHVCSEEIKPVPFVGVTPGDADYIAICNSIENVCNEKNNTKLWRLKNNPNEFYFITKPLDLIKINKKDSRYWVSQLWNFSHYPEKVLDSDQTLFYSGADIFPAIYPLSKTQNAIALIHKFTTSYSGGGKEEQFADFILLEDKGKYKQVLADIPFYGYEMIRACFTEADYKKKSHCHDENWHVLTITMKNTGGEFYSWEITDKSYDWPSFVDKSKIKVRIDKKTVAIGSR